MIRSFYVRMSTGSSAISPTTKGNRFWRAVQYTSPKHTRTWRGRSCAALIVYYILLRKLRRLPSLQVSPSFCPRSIRSCKVR